MKHFRDFKYRLAFIGASGVVIVGIITAIAVYAMKQNIIASAYMDADRIVFIFRNSIEEIRKDISYFDQINYDDSPKKIVAQFENIASIFHADYPMLNGLALVRVYEKNESGQVANMLRDIYGEEIKIREISGVLNKERFNENLFNATVVYKYPYIAEKDIRGLELTSSKSRYDALHLAMRGKKYSVSAPVKLVGEGEIYNGMIYIPFHEAEEGEKNTRWLAAVPFTYEHLLYSILREYGFSDVEMELYDVTSKNHLLIYSNKIGASVEVLRKNVEIGGREYAFDFYTSDLYTVENFWQPIVGFTSGIFFVVFIVYYLYYKESKELEVSALQMKLLQAQEIASIGHFTWDVESRRFLCSEQAAKIFNLFERDVDLSEIKKRVHDQDVVSVEKVIRDCLRGEIKSDNEIEFRIVDEGKTKWIVSKYTLYFEKEKLTKIFGTIQDVTERKKKELELNKQSELFHKMAITDQLTKAYNRSYFEDRLEIAMSEFYRYKKAFSVILFDIDHFKEINDKHGHLMGDCILKELSELIKKKTRFSDIFCRWGGEEFAIVVDTMQKDKTLELAQKLRKAIEENSFSDEIKVTCSFGVSEAQSGDTKEVLLKRCDEALYKAKNGGRNRVETL